MPKSRRDRAVALTKTKKHGRASKERLMEDIKECVSSYSSVYVFEVENMRNVKFKELRDEWGGSRFFLGKNRVMQRAMGRGGEQPRDGTSKLTSYITGQRGLLFTDTSKEDVLSYFSHFCDTHFARSGCIATADFSLDKGPLPADIAPHPLEPTLRKLGLPTRLNASVVELMQDTVVCRAGDVLTPEQCRLLQLFDQKQADFRIHIVAALTYSADDQQGRLEVIQEEAATQLNKETVAAGPASNSKQRRRKAAAAGDERLSTMEAQEEEEEAEEGEEEEGQEQDGDEEFVPEPLEGWGEVAVPAYT